MGFIELALRGVVVGGWFRVENGELSWEEDDDS